MKSHRIYDGFLVLKHDWNWVH